MTPILGVDASTYQGSRGMPVKKFDRLTRAGVRIGIFRATIGTSRDASAGPNIARAGERGWATGVYHFLTPGDGARQAAVYIRELRDLAADGPGFLDVEAVGVTAVTVKAFVRRWRETFPRRDLLCYTAEYAWRRLTGNMDGRSLFDGLWQARWTERGTDEASDLPALPPRAGFGGWRGRPRLWQYGAFHLRAGAGIDGDAWYGTLEQFRALDGLRDDPVDLTERPKYRRAYNALIDEAVRLATVATRPDADSGRAWDQGIIDAREDATEALLGLKLGDPA